MFVIERENSLIVKWPSLTTKIGERRKKKFYMIDKFLPGVLTQYILKYCIDSIWIKVIKKFKTKFVFSIQNSFYRIASWKQSLRIIN